MASPPSRSGSGRTTSRISTSWSVPATPTSTWSTSSLDWGQDLPDLRRWLGEHPTSGRVFISYFGSGDLAYYGIHATRIGDANFDVRVRKAPAVLAGGLWIISVTQFQQDYTEARGPWDSAKEVRYHELLAHMVELSKTGAGMTEKEGNTFEEFQFARLCHYLRGRQPLEELDYTFLIYQLTDEEVTQALYGPISVR